MAHQIPPVTVCSDRPMVMWPVGSVKVLLPPALDGTETPEARATVYHSTVTQLNSQQKILDPSDMVIALSHIMGSTQVGASEREDWLHVLDDQ